MDDASAAFLHRSFGVFAVTVATRGTAVALLTNSLKAFLLLMLILKTNGMNSSNLENEQSCVRDSPVTERSKGTCVGDLVKNVGGLDGGCGGCPPSF